MTSAPRSEWKRSTTRVASALWLGRSGELLVERLDQTRQGASFRERLAVSPQPQDLTDNHLAELQLRFGAAPRTIEAPRLTPSTLPSSRPRIATCASRRSKPGRRARRHHAFPRRSDPWILRAETAQAEVPRSATPAVAPHGATSLARGRAATPSTSWSALLWSPQGPTWAANQIHRGRPTVCERCSMPRRAILACVPMWHPAEAGQSGISISVAFQQHPSRDRGSRQR